MAVISRQALNFQAIQPLRTRKVTVSSSWRSVLSLLWLGLTAAVAPWHSPIAKALQVDRHLPRQRRIARIEALDLIDRRPGILGKVEDVYFASR